MIAPWTWLRARVVAATNDLFSHAPYPLDGTGRYHGDPGLFGPGAVTWEIVGDAAVFVGGIRALLVQAAHPEVVAGVFDHSKFREDPLGRLSRTSAYVTATSFGAVPEVERAVQTVRIAHRPIMGQSHRGREYAAAAPPLAAWVHNALTESFLAAYQHFGERTLSQEDSDRFVAEQVRVGALLGAAPLPNTAAALQSWVNDLPDLDVSPGMKAAVGFLSTPPLILPVRMVYRVLFEAAVTTLPPRVRTVLGLRSIPGAHMLGAITIRLLRRALGRSPSWELAVRRATATRMPVPGEGESDVLG